MKSKVKNKVKEVKLILAVCSKKKIHNSTDLEDSIMTYNFLKVFQAIFQTNILIHVFYLLGLFISLSSALKACSANVSKNCNCYNYQR